MPDAALPAAPQEAVRERHRLPLVWLVPIVAALAAGWLGYRTLAQRGPEVEVTLRTADGIEAGRTQVRHNQIELGTVVAMEPSADLSQVTLRVRMNRYAEGHLNTGTRFWVVRPRLSAEGISGLGTLISGAYVEMEPGPGTPTRQFTALEDPPVLAADVPGTEYVLHGQRLGSVGQGAPVSFHGINVGEVLGYVLSDQDGTATAHIFVRAPHDQLVHDGTRFWNASGVSVAVGAEGLRLQSESLQSILAGGVAFDVPPGGTPGPVAKAHATFTLYGDPDAAREALFTRRVPFLLHVPGSAGGLSVGAPVRMQGIQVGNVTDVHMEYDAQTGRLSVPVTIELEPQRVRILHADPSEAGFEQRSYDTFRAFVRRGLRAQLASGSLITGQKVIALAFVPDAPRSEMIEGGASPEIPMIDTDDLDTVVRSAKGLLATIKDAVASLNGILVSPEVKGSVRSLDRSLANLDRLTHEAGVQAPPLLASLRSVSGAADRTLRQANATLASAGSALSEDGGAGNLAGTLTELKRAAQSLRALADYLENHPGSLAWGKGAGAGADR